MSEDRTGADELGHITFLVLLAGKALLGVIQVATAIAIFLGVTQQLPAIAEWLMRSELIEDPTDAVATRILDLATVAQASETGFYSVYFLAHGGLHIGVVIALLIGAGWAYPAAIAVLAAFVLFQSVDWLSAGGVMLLVLSAIDLLVIYLTWREWAWHARIKG